MKFRATMVALAALAAMSTAHAAGFVNGGFESGDFSDWTLGGGSRAGTLNNVLDPAKFLAGGSLYNASIASSHSKVIDKTYVDPHVPVSLPGGVKGLGTTVYSGDYAARVEDTATGGYASVLTQTVNNYTDSDIFFAWKAVMLGAHGINDAATMVITLTDLNDGTVLINREYNAATGGAGLGSGIFLTYNNNYYTPDWQIEQLSIDASRQGHSFELSVLAADCSPTAHWGYVYLDGFGAQAPEPQPVPEPASLALVGLALAGAAAARRRRKA